VVNEHRHIRITVPESLAAILQGCAVMRPGTAFNAPPAKRHAIWTDRQI
jgi:hypothetical protein